MIALLLILAIVGVSSALLIMIYTVNKKPDPLPNHRPPNYHGYWRYARGGFSKLTKCSNCGVISLKEDQHYVDPCSRCGHSVEPIPAGKWNETHWINRDGEIVE